MVRDAWLCSAVSVSGHHGPISSRLVIAAVVAAHGGVQEIDERGADISGHQEHAGVDGAD